MPYAHVHIRCPQFRNGEPVDGDKDKGIVQRSLQTLRTARRLWETNLIDHNIASKKARGHPHCVAALHTEIDDVIAKAVAIDQELLTLDSGNRSTQQYDVKTATTPINTLHDLMTTAKSASKEKSHLHHILNGA